MEKGEANRLRSIDIESPRSCWPPADLETVPNCPICSSDDRLDEISGLEDRIFGSAPGKWTLVRCAHCLSAYLDPRPNMRTIAQAYRNYYTHEKADEMRGRKSLGWIRDALANSYRNRHFGTNLAPSVPGGWVLASLARQRAWSLRLDGRGLDRVRTRGGNLLDVGSGNGAFLNFVKSAGWHGFGVEPDEDAAKLSRTDGAVIVAGQLRDLQGHMEGKFDVITMNHVIEHLHYPVQALQECWNLLKEGGFIWLETPNINSIGYELYSSFWRGLEAPRHLILFNPASLVQCLKDAGFSIVQVLKPRDALDYTFSRSALVASGSLAEVDPAPLSSREQKTLNSNIREARKLIKHHPERSEFITAIAYK